MKVLLFSAGNGSLTRPKRDGSDAVQVCAQALCLEELLNVAIPEAAGQTPPAAYAKKCDACPLLELCLPRKTGVRSGRSVARYLARAAAEPDG